jgi:UDP-N-acetylglucosamine 3-dehydrogenase
MPAEGTGRADRDPGLVFLGCGGAARAHAKRLGSIGRTTTYFASRDAAKAAAFARELGGVDAFGSYEAALRDPRPTAAVIVTPPASHRELTLAALAAGKDVIVEKPAFLRSTDADDVAEAARAAGRLVLVAENYHYKPIAGALRRVIADGTLGQVRFIVVNALKRQESRDWRNDATQAGGGALFEGGVHWVNFMANLGLDVRAVHGSRPGTSDGARDLERSMLVRFDYEGGAVGVLAHSWEAGHPLRGMRLSAVHGTEGSAHFESNGLGLLVLGRRVRIALPGVRDFLGYGAMWRDFLRALRERREPAMTLAMARRDLAIVEEAYRTAGIGG